MKWPGPIFQAWPLRAAASQDSKPNVASKRHQARERDLSKSGGDILQADPQRRRQRQHDERQEIEHIVVVAAPQIIGARGEKTHEADEAHADPARVGPQLSDGHDRGRGEREPNRTCRIGRENSGRIADVGRKARN